MCLKYKSNFKYKQHPNIQIQGLVPIDYESIGLERNTEREGNLSNVPKGNFVSAEVKLEK